MSCVLCVNKFEYMTYDPPKVMVDGIVLRHTHILIQVHNNSNSRVLYLISHVSGMTSCHLYSKLHCKIAIEHCSTWIKCNSCMHILNRTYIDMNVNCQSMIDLVFSITWRVSAISKNTSVYNSYTKTLTVSV